MNFDKRSDSTVALTSYINCSEGSEGGIDGPASSNVNLSTIDENEDSNNKNYSSNINTDDVLININNLSRNSDVNNLQNKEGSNDKGWSSTRIENQTSNPEQMKVRLTKYDYNIPLGPNKDNPSLKKLLCEKAKKCCTKKLLYKRIPILSWLPQYKAQMAVADLVAGFTVGLTVIPQAIAYANVAGLPPQYGLYSAFMACFIYTIFGSCKDSPLGPTAILAILTRENLHGLGPEFAVFLCFLSGCVELLMGILQLGFLIDFISGPVSAGFTSAAAIIIATSQVKDLLGLSVSGGKFLDVWENIFYNISETRLGDAILGVVCMTVLLVLRKIKDIQIGPKEVKDKTKMEVFFSQFLWFISTSRNIIVVVVCAVLAYVYHENENKNGPFILTGTVKGGLPEFNPPPFSAVVGNRTYSFADMTSSLGSALLVVPLLSILENMSLAKVFAKGKSIDATQEMLAIGLCNIASSFVSSMPVSGALSRGAVNNASGVQTTFGGIYTGLSMYCCDGFMVLLRFLDGKNLQEAGEKDLYTFPSAFLLLFSGIIVLLSLQFFTPYFYYIPKASLAAVIIAAVVFMVEFHVVKPMWKTKKIDLIPAFATFLSCLFIRLELGIVIGISINVLFLLYASARPTVRVEKETSLSGCEYLRVTPDRSLVFPSVEYVRNVVTKAGLKQGSSYIPVVIDSRHIQGVDFTAAKGIKSLIDDFMNRKQPILFYNLKPSIVEIFQGVRPKEFIYCTNETELNDFLKEYHSRP